MKKYRVLFLAILAALICTAIPRAAEKADFTARYDYDKSLPLNVFEREVSQNKEFTQYQVQFDSTNGERVPALLNLPVGAEAPYPCIIAQHGYGGNKKDMMIVAISIARMGYAMLAIDAQYHGERKQRGKDIFSLDVDDDLQALTQTVVDLRRAVDYLESRDDMDADRISYIGISMGALLGSVFNGVEGRTKAPILIVGGGGWRTLIQDSQIGPAIAMRKHLEEKNLNIDDYADMMQSVDPVNFIGMISPRPVLFINGKRDVIVPVSSNKLLHQAAGEPKEIIWFDGIEADPTGHIPPIRDMLETIEQWWKENL